MAKITPAAMACQDIASPNASSDHSRPLGDFILPNVSLHSANVVLFFLAPRPSHQLPMIFLQGCNIYIPSCAYLGLEAAGCMLMAGVPIDHPGIVAEGNFIFVVLFTADYP